MQPSQFHQSLRAAGVQNGRGKVAGKAKMKKLSSGCTERHAKVRHPELHHASVSKAKALRGGSAQNKRDRQTETVETGRKRRRKKARRRQWRSG